MTLFNPTDLRNRIEQLGDLPTLPHVVQRLATMIASPTVSAEDIGTIIEKDQVLAAKVLRIALIQATLLMARLEQPGLPRYQFSPKEYDLVYSAFGNMSSLSAKFIIVVPMNPVTGSDPKKTKGWVMEIGDAWSGLFQVEKSREFTTRHNIKPGLSLNSGEVEYRSLKLDSRYQRTLRHG